MAAVIIVANGRITQRSATHPRPLTRDFGVQRYIQAR